MSFWKKVVNIVSAPVVAPVQFVKDVAKGENVLEAAKGAIGTQSQVYFGAAGVANDAFGGTLGDIAGATGIGRPIQKTLELSSAVTSGDTSLATRSNLGVESVKSSALVGAFALGPSALGVTKAQFAGGALLAPKLLSDPKNTIATIAGGYASGFLGDYGIPVNFGTNDLDQKIYEAPRGPTKAQTSNIPLMQPGGFDPKILLIGAAVIAGVFVIAKKRG